MESAANVVSATWKTYNWEKPGCISTCTVDKSLVGFPFQGFYAAHVYIYCGATFLLGTLLLIML